ncbi:uncharacterized protein [Pseudorasbora parva]|uniref:uncharacterized protein isoform X2 n=1 Tax=Pseudorasbora parva TaxID=51549 RepID=UPI00351EBF7A
MIAVNAGQLLILVWTLTAVCQADDGDISVICEDVTGTEGEEVSLTCRVSLKCSERCIKLYKFQYPEGDSAICRKEFPEDSCEQRDRLTCRFTPTTAKAEQFRFFVQTLCGRETTEFTVSITDSLESDGSQTAANEEPIARGIFPEDHDMEEANSNLDKYEQENPDGGFKVAVTAAAVSCFIIVIIPIIYKVKLNYDQKRMFWQNCPVNEV